MYRILFFGTSDFAVPSLKALAADGRFEIVSVVTQPDRPVGRHAEVTATAVKTAALELAIKTIQPEKIKDDFFQTRIKEIGPDCDAFVVISYGKILPQWLLDLPKKGVLNVHGSLLPRWRGASPIHAAIAAGDGTTGVTIMTIDAEMDHGPILATKETSIAPDETGGQLHDRLAQLGAETLPDVLADYLDGKLTPREQDHDNATYCKVLTRDDGKIDWSRQASDIASLVRAYQPWPGTWTMVHGKRLKIQKTYTIMADENLPAGQCFVFDQQPSVACGDGTALVLVTVQLEGKKATTGAEFLRGFQGWENVKLN
jgi:methionyl-tRNA formyltransferase